LTLISHYLSKLCKETNYDRQFVEIKKKGQNALKSVMKFQKNWRMLWL